MNRNRKTLVLTLLATFVLMALLVVYTTRVILKTAYTYTYELGNDRTAAITADLENYLENAKSVLWVAADTVDHMVANGASDEDIIEYITRESANTEAQFDESYTGIYGVIRGHYVDGVGWIPPQDYDPTVRDWYVTTVAAGGEPVIVSPYVDAQTGNVIISICKALTDNNNVLSLDLTLAGVQEIVDDINIDGTGYGFILNYDGMVIAHPDKNEKGTYYTDTEQGKALFEKAVSVGKGNFDINLDGKAHTVFVDRVMDQWYLIIVTDNSELFAAPRSVLLITALVNLVVFSLISAFYILGYRHERKVNKRIDELKEKQRQKDYEAKLLKLEKSAADSANKAKSDFLADMSHEIRTPINAVLGMNEMILHESDDDNILEYASNIKSAGNTLLSIINNILDFSKIEDGKMDLVPVEFDTAELISTLVNSISERAKRKKLDLVVNVDETVPSKLYGDDVRISQVIMNLLTNAVKYTENGTVTLNVKNVSVSGDKATLRVDVVDTGIGIKEEDLDKLFMSFERIEEKRNRHIEGTGLGISIVTKLLAMMDSKLDVKSEYGKGSTFGFDLTLKVVDPAPIGKYEEKRKIVARTKSKDDRIKAPEARILVTDDNDMNLKVASNLLKFFDIKPVCCSSGFETIDIMRKEKFDILFLDHMMPKMDGIETLKAMKDEGILGDTVVIALTANAVVGAKEQYISNGFTDYLSKPIIVDELEKLLAEYLPASKITAKAAPAEPEAVAVSDTKLTIDKARSFGLDVDEGVGYTAGDEDFYLEMLEQYANDADDKISKLESFKKDSDWKNYDILVHAVKSSSKTIGSNDLFTKAKDLEMAAKSSDDDFINANHDQFISDYKGLADKILGRK